MKALSHRICVFEGALFDTSDPNCFITLQEGWNFVGCPISVGYYDNDHPDIVGVDTWIEVDPPVVEYVFESISGKYSTIIGEKGAYSPDLLPGFNSLHYIAPCQAFWIKMKGPANLKYP